MLKKETIDKVKAMGFDVDKLIAAIKEEKEVDYAVPEIVPMTQAEIDARDAIKIGEGKTAGEAAAREAFVKEVGTKLNLQLKGGRIGDLVTEVQKGMNATNDDKVKTLQDQVTALTTDKENLNKELGSEKSKTSDTLFQFELISHLPANRGKNLRDDERVLMMTRDITFETVGGKKVAKRNGEIVKDSKTHAPLPVPDVVKLYATERGWDKETVAGKDGGRGGGSDGGSGGASGLKKYSAVKDQWVKDNPDKNVMSTEFTDHVNKIAKETTDFDMYS